MSIPCVIVINQGVVNNLIQCEDGDHAEKVFINEVDKVFKKEDWDKSEADAIEDGYMDWEGGAVCISWAVKADLGHLIPDLGHLSKAEKEEEVVFCIDCVSVDFNANEFAHLCSWAQDNSEYKMDYVVGKAFPVPLGFCHKINKDGKCPNFAQNHGGKDLINPNETP